MPLLPVPVPIGKPLLHQIHGFGFSVFLPKRLHCHEFFITCFRKIHNRKLSLPVSNRHPAAHILLPGIQIEDKFRLGRQIAGNLLRVFLHDIHHTLQLRQHGIIELCQVIPPHLEIQGAVGAEPGNGPDLFPEFLLQPAEGILTHVIGRPHTIIKVWHAAVH